MKTKYISIAVLIGSILAGSMTGCTQLDVKVAVFDQKKYFADEELRKKAEAEAENRAKEKAEAKSAARDRKAAKRDLTAAVDEVLQSMQRVQVNAATFRPELLEKIQTLEQMSTRRDIANLAGVQEVFTATHDIKRSANDPTTRPTEAAKIELEQKRDMVLQTNPTNGETTSDESISILANAGDQYWKGLSNQCFAAGFIGNTDIAFRQNGIADYTIKGVRVDAEQATKATFSTLRQTLKIVAAGYGIPVKLQTGSATSNVSATETDYAAKMAELEAGRASNELAVQRSKYAAGAILSKIASHADDLKKKPETEEYKAAVKDIQDCIKANSGRLKGE